MGVRIYWGDDYFYAVAVDGEYEYMTYEEYLLLKHRTPGYAVVFDKPPKIRDGRPVCFELSVYEVERVERLGENLFVVRTSEGENILTDGEISARSSEAAINFLRENFDPDSLVIITGYAHTNASYVLYSGGKFIVVYDRVYLTVDEKTLEFLESDRENSVILVIDTTTVPAVESVYEFDGNGYRYLGRRYSKEIPIYDGGYLGGCDASRVGTLLPGDFIVRVGKGGLKIVAKLKKYLRSFFRKKADIDDVPPREGVIDYVFSDFLGTVKAVFERGRKFYFVNAPVNAYLYGSLDFLLGTYGKPLPIRREGNLIVVDYESVSVAEGRRKGKHTIKVMGYEAVDLGYALMIRSGKEKIFCPLVESDVRGEERVFMLSLDDYKMLLGDEGDLHESFCVIVNTVIRCSHKAFFSEGMVNGQPLVKLGNFAVPSGGPAKFMEKYGHLVRDVVYVPDTDGYAVVFDLGEFFVGIDVGGNGFIVLPDENFIMPLGKDYRTVEGFYFNDAFGLSYRVREPSYFKIKLKGGRASVNFIKGKGARTHMDFIDYPIARPGVVYWDCGLYLSIRGRPVVKLFDFCLPGGYEVLGIESFGNSYIVRVQNKETGEVFVVMVLDKDYFIVGKEGVEQDYQCDDADCVYNILEIARAYGWDSIPLLI